MVWATVCNAKDQSKKIATIVAMIILVVLASVNASVNAQPIVPSKSPPLLHVSGNRIVDNNGSVIVLRGVSTEDMYYMCYYRQLAQSCLNENAFAQLSQNWHVNIVKIPVYPDLWGHDPTYAERFLDPIVNWGAKYGMYILLAWMAHGNAITGQVELPDWGKQEPWHGSPYNASLSLATNFLSTVGERYKGVPYVIYSIFCEPSYITWDEWRPVAEQLVDVLHSHNPTALVLVPGVDWAYDLRGAGNNPVARDNVVYEDHPYYMKSVWSGPWEQWFGFLADRHPILAGEWGFEPGFASDPNLNATVENYGRPLLAYMASKGMSWTACYWSPYWSPRMLTSLYVPSEFGQLVEDTIAQLITISLSVKSKTAQGADVPGIIVNLDGKYYVTPFVVTVQGTHKLSVRMIPNINNVFYHFVGWQDATGNTISTMASLTFDTQSSPTTFYAVFAQS